MNELTTLSLVSLYTLPPMIGILMLFLFFWQLQVLRGEGLKNKEGSIDLWHEK